MDILVIDDDPDVVSLLSLLLKTNGHRPTGAYGGEEGLKIVKEIMPDLILLDIMMPGIDGFNVLRQLRFDKTTENIPVIFVSAINDEESKRKAESLGSQGYITKPYERNQLMETINKVIHHLK